MQCPSCQVENSDGQRFCGSCGHKLEVVCAKCQAANPLDFKFCGRCGASLADVGAMVMARSGLITQVNQKALDLLGYQQKEVQGKPFSLFIERADLVIFFSHLNELLSSTQKQSFEISLKHPNQNGIYVLLEMTVDAAAPKGIDAIDITLADTTDSRLIADKLQTQQELVGLMLMLTNNINTVSDQHLAYAIEDALKKICLFSLADHCCIYAFNRISNALDPVYEWRHPAVFPPEKYSKSRSIPLSKVKQTIVRLRQEKTIVIHDTAKLMSSERDELNTWFQSDTKAVICQLIYSNKIPVGVICVARKSGQEEWTPNCAALVKFFSDFIADRLPFSAELRKSAGKSPTPHDGTEKIGKKSGPEISGKGSNGSEMRIDESGKSTSASTATDDRSSAESWRILPNTTRPMIFEKFSGDPSMEQLAVFLRDDGLVLLTCPQCGLQESVSADRFNQMGKTIGVNCPCSKHFAAVLEKRRFFRKPVRFEGYFSLGGDLGPIATTGSIWGQMVVEDLSKAGLRFTSDKANLIHPGDLLKVRFNLDNAHKSLIHKPARVIFVSGHGVGCRFEGEDNYDITLGFYFM